MGKYDEFTCFRQELNKKILEQGEPGHQAFFRPGRVVVSARGKRKKLGLENQLSFKIIDDAPTGRACRKPWAKLIFLSVVPK